MAINRAYFRLSELAYAQHETALVQIVSKLLLLGKTTEDKISLYRFPVVRLGELLVTGVYDDGVFKSAIVTRVDENDAPITNTVSEPVNGLPETLL